MQAVYTVNGVSIRLTEERWAHIISNKPYMEAYEERILDAIERPDIVTRGYSGSLIAILAIAKHQYLHVVYKEVSLSDGFVITAYMARDYHRKQIVWTHNS